MNIWSLILWIILTVVVLLISALLRKKLWQKYEDKIKDFFFIITRTRTQKILTVLIGVSILALMGLGVWLIILSQRPPLEPEPLTHEEKYAIWFIEDVLPNVKEDVPLLPLNILVQKLEAKEVVELHRQYREKESTTIVKYYPKFEGEEGYHLFFVPWNFSLYVAIGTTGIQMNIDTYVSQFLDIPEYIIPAEPKLPEIKRPVSQQWWYGIGIVFILIIGLGVGVWFFGRRQYKLGREFAKICSERHLEKKIYFDDIGGIEEVKQEIREVVNFVQNADKFKALGATVPKGILMVGPPGNAKTMLAEAVATEADCPFISISGSEFIEMFVGVGAARIRDFFGIAKKLVKEKGRCIVFIDEIDAVGKKREVSVSGGGEEHHQTLEQLMVEMDGFSSGSGIIVLAATNRKDMLDPALIRPGRFDREVYIDNPHVKDREAILRIHAKNKVITDDIDFRELAQSIPLGSSGADLANIINEAAIRAALIDKDKIDKECLQYAKDKMMFGLERKGLIVTDQEKKITAYHESGHALVAEFSSSMPPLNRVSIIPRAKALGYTYVLPEEDKYIQTKEEILELINVLMGGKAAEEVCLGISGSTGAKSDLEQATRAASSMVCIYGMDEKMGPISIPALRGEGRAIQFTDEVVQQRVILINTEALVQAKELIKKHKPNLEALARVLLVREDIEGKLATEILKNKKLAKEISKADEKELEKIIENIKKGQP